MEPEERRLWDVFFRGDPLPPDFMAFCELSFCEPFKKPAIVSPRTWSIFAISCVDWLSRRPVYTEQYPLQKAPSLKDPAQRDAFYKWDADRTRAADAAGLAARRTEIARQLAHIDQFASVQTSTLKG
jgi:hypothetical protein